MLLLMSLSTACLAQNHKGQAQEEVDIDEWQVMRVAASKDPFERSRQFSITLPTMPRRTGATRFPEAR